jgi:predicted transcriptional regulator
MEFHATKKVVDFLLLMEKQGNVTKNTQKILYTPQYYIMKSYLKNFGLIEQNGTHLTQKVWVLTEKGKKIAHYFKKIREEIERDG